MSLWLLRGTVTRLGEFGEFGESFRYYGQLFENFRTSPNYLASSSAVKDASKHTNEFAICAFPKKPSTQPGESRTWIF
jgi:hypothetical protein